MAQYACAGRVGCSNAPSKSQLWDAACEKRTCFRTRGVPSVSDALTQPGEPAATLPPPPIKSKPRTSREFEHALRELGFSKTEARTIASHGFKGLAETDPAEDASELAALTERLKTFLDRTERQI